MHYKLVVSDTFTCLWIQFSQWKILVTLHTVILSNKHYVHICEYKQQLTCLSCLYPTNELDRTRTVGPYRYIPGRSEPYTCSLKYPYGSEHEYGSVADRIGMQNILFWMFFLVVARSLLTIYLIDVRGNWNPIWNPMSHEGNFFHKWCQAVAFSRCIFQFVLNSHSRFICRISKLCQDVVQENVTNDLECSTNVPSLVRRPFSAPISHARKDW